MINEGLREKDLNNLVLDLISIDEYKSKLGDDHDILVVAFFVKDEDPANDLMHFIEKGNNDILDSDVSPAPNEDGYYLVFTEFSRSEKFPKELLTVIHSMSTLVDIENWKFKPYKYDKQVDLTKENLKKFLTLNKKEALKKEKVKEIRNFLRTSKISDILFENDDLYVSGFYGSFILDSYSFGKIDEILKQHDLLNEAIKFDDDTKWQTRKILRILGEGWDVSVIKDRIILTKNNNDFALVGKFTGII